MKKDYAFCGNTFMIENYASKPAFTDFLPAVAGLGGRPLWAFYINRGQGIAGFGVRGKENAVMEFFPAEIAYAEAPRKGFRTFLKINGKYREPFEVNGKRPTCMKISRSGFSIEEKSPREYVFRAEYFGVPSRDYAALARIVTYANRSDGVQEVEFLDGLAQVLPYGLSNSAFKETGNLFKSWMCVDGVERNFAFYKMRSSTADSSEVTKIDGGNFFVSACDKCTTRPVVDPKIVFGEDKTATRAGVFEKTGISENAFLGQNTENEFACAFAHGKVSLAPGETVTLVELIGYADGEERAERLACEIDVESVVKMREEAEEVTRFANRVRTHTAYPLFDEYVCQSYFDNVLRGGMPVTLGDKVYYVYSRKHGDPERDYNAFVIEPQPYSCGNGNFRDVAQNRRNDVLITPECGDFNVRYFFSLLQLDGYNPLAVLGVRYTFKGEIPPAYAAHEAFLRGEFTVGDLCVQLRIKDEEEIAALLSGCETVYKAAFGEGYWTDHFVYLVDLIESYLAVYPDRAQELLFQTPYRWFQSGARVLPRSRKTVLRKDGAVRRFESVVKTGGDGWATTESGEYVTTSLAAKLLHLIAIKTATLDPLGCGIDMEADKPGWCDATNGLPAVFGSNVADAVELKRLTAIFEELFRSTQGEIVWSEEQGEFFEGLLSLLRRDPPAEEFYEESNDLKEAFREKAYAGLKGATAALPRDSVLQFTALVKKRLGEGLERAKNLGDGWYPTYLRFEAETYERLAETANGLPCVKVKKFKAYALPHFAEGVAKGLTVGETALYGRAKHSALYDETLGLYRSSEPLDGESMEIGRIRSFPKGWLERESCFLHMNYKLMLSLLSAGLYDEFYKEIETNLVPFMDPARYGRSTLENSSFLATSNHCDRGKWGRGFQARLTGANAEVLSMWRKMMGIERPFTLENGELQFALSPVLHKKFFDGEGRVSFTLFGKTEVVYKNASGKSTYEEGVHVAGYRLVGDGFEETAAQVKGVLAENVRGGKYHKIEVEIK